MSSEMIQLQCVENRMRLRGDYLMLICELPGYRPHSASELMIPETVVEDSHVLGQVAGLGPDVRGIGWGDSFELDKHCAMALYERCPLENLYDLWGDGYCVRFRNPNGGPEYIDLRPGQKVAICRVDALVVRYATCAENFDPSSDPVPHPVADKVMLRHRNHAAGTLATLNDGEAEPVAQVVAVGYDVTEVAPGDWVYCPLRAGVFKLMEGQRISVVREDKIELRFDGGEPGDVQ